jgi:putative FmdB family regulatory protein
MPLYEYHCEKCDKDFELLRKMSEADDEAICPGCGEAHTERKMSTVSTSSTGTAGSGTFSPAACSAFT